VSKLDQREISSQHDDTAISLPRETFSIYL